MLPTAAVFIILLLLLLEPPREKEIAAGKATTSLSRDGFTVLNATSVSDLMRRTLAQLPAGYRFLDYSYEIRGTSLETWHRDVTSGQTYHGAAHPTYTVIHYLCAGPLLSVSPGSHKTLPFSWSAPLTLRGDFGTAVLFNADLLHAGAPNTMGSARWAIQYKVAHVSDLLALSHLAGKHVAKDGRHQRESGCFRAAVNRWFSWKTAWLTNSVLYPLMQRRYDGWLGQLQRLVGIEFYNNPHQS
jgi:hypothetical protein